MNVDLWRLLGQIQGMSLVLDIRVNTNKFRVFTV